MKSFLDVLLENYKTVRRKYVDNGAPEEKVKEYLTRFRALSDQNKLKDDEKDIDRMGKMGFTDFIQFVEKKEKEVTKTQLNTKKIEGNRILVDTLIGKAGTKYEVYVPLDKEASCNIGKHTDWCTTKVNQVHYERYMSIQTTLIYFTEVDEESGKRFPRMAVSIRANDLQAFSPVDRVYEIQDSPKIVNQDLSLQQILGVVEKVKNDPTIQAKMKKVHEYYMNNFINVVWTDLNNLLTAKKLNIEMVKDRLGEFFQTMQNSNTNEDKDKYRQLFSNAFIPFYVNNLTLHSYGRDFEAILSKAIYIMNDNYVPMLKGIINLAIKQKNPIVLMNVAWLITEEFKLPKEITNDLLEPILNNISNIILNHALDAINVSNYIWFMRDGDDVDINFRWKEFETAAVKRLQEALNKNKPEDIFRIANAMLAYANSIGRKIWDDDMVDILVKTVPTLIRNLPSSFDNPGSFSGTPWREYERRLSHYSWQ